MEAESEVKPAMMDGVGRRATGTRAAKQCRRPGSEARATNVVAAPELRQSTSLTPSETRPAR